MYRCNECNSEFLKWSWKCPNCWSWNSISEIEEFWKDDKKKKQKWKAKEIFTILDSKEDIIKVQLKSDELNNVLWKGLTPWSLILLSWEPGIWKSTLALQIWDWYSDEYKSALYISWEENVFQISQRAKRLWVENKNLKIFNSNDFEDIIETIDKDDSELIIIDSISVIYTNSLWSGAWSIWQIRYIAEILMEYSKKSKKSIIIIWHVTKDWSISWPKTLEHLVDTVLFLEWSKYENYRMLRTLKNRFWPTDEVWLFEMSEKWLTDISNPWLEFINRWDMELSWSALSITMEWNRPILIEIEALTTYTKFWYPKRSSRWIQSGKLDLLLAVITKFTETKLESYDIYTNIWRWLTIWEPWVDLAIVASVLSSKKWKKLWSTVYIWEVSLTWVVKNVYQLDKRVDEALKLWFEKIIVPEWCYKWKWDKSKIIWVKNIRDFEKII